MIFKTLPEKETHNELFFKYKHSNEDLGIASIDMSKLNFYPDDHTFLGHIKKYFTEGIDFNYTKFKNDLYTNPKEYAKYQQCLENYTKAVWLTKIFLSNGFKNLLGAHWNPQISKWDIHPGGTRQTVLRLFSKEDKIDFLAFNTGGAKTNFKRTFNNYNQLRSSFKNAEDIYMCVTADHGSLIPHVHFDQRSLREASMDYIVTAKNFYKTTHVKFNNFNIDSLEYKPPKNPTSCRTVTLENPNDLSNVVRAFLLLPNFETFNDYGVKIERT